MTDLGNGRYSIKPVAGNIFRIGANSTLTLGFQASKNANLALSDLNISFESLTSVVYCGIIEGQECVDCNEDPCECPTVCNCSECDECYYDEIIEGDVVINTTTVISDKKVLYKGNVTIDANVSLNSAVVVVRGTVNTNSGSLVLSANSKMHIRPLAKSI